MKLIRFGKINKEKQELLLMMTIMILHHLEKIIMNIFWIGWADSSAKIY